MKLQELDQYLEKLEKKFCDKYDNCCMDCDFGSYDYGGITMDHCDLKLSIFNIRDNIKFYLDDHDEEEDEEL